MGWWLAALAIVGVIVWGLIIYVSIALPPRRPGDDVPLQTPLQPADRDLLHDRPGLMVVVVFFYFTVTRQKTVLLDDTKKPDRDGQRRRPAVGVGLQLHRPNVQDAGTSRRAARPAREATLPTLYLPVRQAGPVRARPRRDVIHSFWVPAFLFKMDVIPGRTTSSRSPRHRSGTFEGKCAELCGAYHSRMLFNVKVVSQAEFDAHVAELRAQGQTGELLGNSLNRSAASSRRTRSSCRNTGATAWPHDPDRESRPALGHRHASATLGRLVKWLTTTDHKVIGNLYFITSFVFFLFGWRHGAADPRRAGVPGLQIVDNDDQFNQLFTMHGTIMLLLFATPLFAGFANAIMPLQIGSPDVAFPRLNMFELLAVPVRRHHRRARASSPPTARPTSAGSPTRRCRTTCSSPASAATCGSWACGSAGLGTILGAVNFVTTIICMRAPGMTMFRMPIFTWNMLVTSLLVLIAFPILAAALLVLGADRKFGAHVFDPSQRRPDAVAAPVLVLRASRGLHHRVAVLRHHHRDPAGVQPQADLRLQDAWSARRSPSPPCRSACGRTTCT